MVHVVYIQFQKRHPEQLADFDTDKKKKNNAGDVSVSSGKILKKKFQHPPAFQKELNEKLMKLIVNKNLPLAVLDGEEFNEIVHRK